MTTGILIFNAGIVGFLLIARIMAEQEARNPTRQDDNDKIHN